MKKLFLPFALILLLTSCGSKKIENERPDFNINSVVSIEYMQNVLSAEVSTITDGTMTMEIINPEILKGITVVCGMDDISVHYGDLMVIFR